MIRNLVTKKWQIISGQLRLIDNFPLVEWFQGYCWKIVFLNGPTPAFLIYLVSSNKKYNFNKSMRKSNIFPVYSAVIWTLDLSKIGCLS